MNTTEKRSQSWLQRIRHSLSAIDINNPQLARFLCKLIPASCPFERDIQFFNHHLFHIPPLCKINPFYEEVVELRFKSLVYLAERCGEDITAYY